MGTNLPEDHPGPSPAAPSPRPDDVTAGFPPQVPPPQVPPGPGLPPTRRRTGLMIAAVAVVAVVLLAAVAIGAVLLLGRDGDGDRSAAAPPAPTTASTPPSTTTTTLDATSPPTEPTVTWESAGTPSTNQQLLLDNAETMFATADSCRPIDDLDDDPFNVYPQGPDVATIECRYGEEATIVFSLFADDASMSSFFAGRLRGRNLARGSGTFGSTPPWQVDYTDDPDRGTGAIFGAQRVTDGGERSEIGFIREGLRTYAYSFSVGTDFPTFYRWWSEIFGGPAPRG